MKEDRRTCACLGPRTCAAPPVRRRCRVFGKDGAAPRHRRLSPWHVFRHPPEGAQRGRFHMNHSPVSRGTMPPRLRIAVDAIRHGRAVVLIDDDDRENEGDLIVAAERLTVPMMATLIRE